MRTKKIAGTINPMPYGIRFLRKANIPIKTSPTHGRNVVIVEIVNA
jgi:hypothetical protein